MAQTYRAPVTPRRWSARADVSRRALCWLCLVTTASVTACYAAPQGTGAQSSEPEASSVLAGDGNSGAAYAPLPNAQWWGANVVPQAANTLCIDGVVATGNGVWLERCSGTVLQGFKWQEGALVLAGDRCLDIDTSAGTPAPGTAVQLAPCDTSRSTQLWAYGGGMIFPEVTGRTAPPTLCLATVGQELAPATPLALANCGTAGQSALWDLALFDGNTWRGFPISSGIVSTYCMDDKDDAATFGTVVRAWPCNHAQAQLYQVRQGTVQINGVCLDITYGATAEKTPMQLYECLADDPNQNFTIEHGQIRPWLGVNVNKCITIPNAAVANAPQLVTMTCGDGNTLDTNPEMHWVMGADAL